MIVPLIAFFSLLLVFRTGARGLMSVGDSLFPFFPQESFQRLLYVWNAHNILGKDDSAMLSQIPWYSLAALLDRLGFPLWLINRLWFALPFFLLGFSMYFLSGVIFGKERNTSRLISTLFFMFNPFTLNLLASGSVILTLTFATGVIVFALFVRGLSHHSRKVAGWRDAILIGLVSVFATANIQVFVMTSLLCFAYLLFFVLVHRRDRVILFHSFRFSLAASGFLLLVNSWWLVPFLYQFTNPGYFSTLFAAGTDVGTLEFTSQFTSIFDVSRLFYGMKPTANFPISAYYHYLLAPTTMMVLVVLAFAVSLFRKKTKFEVFFLLLAVASVILASGTRPPLGFVYRFLWDHMPYFHIFRTSNRFNLYTMISYAILLGFLYQHGEGWIRRSRSFIISFLLISIFLPSWPLLSGDIYGQLKPHQIPKDYYQLREFLQNQEGDFRIMSLPMKDWLTPYSWSAPFDMQEILIDFSLKDVIVNLPGYLQDLEDREVSEDDPAYAIVYKHPESSEALEVLRLMGVRYLIVHRDYVVVWGNYYPVDVSELTRALQESEGIDFVKSFGDLDVYEVADVKPRVFATTGEVFDVKINPTEYRVTVENTTEPFTLVLTENFHPGWEGSVGNHIKFANFANGWEISPEDYEGGEIVLRYRPQKLFDLGLAVSILSLAVGLSILLYLGLRKK